MSEFWQRYLACYGEPEACPAAESALPDFETVLVIPAFDEADDFLDSVLPAAIGDLLVVVVVNAPEDAEPTALVRTRSLLQALGGAKSAPIRTTCYDRRRNVHLLVVDRASAGRLIPGRQGVGRARKIGADCALTLMARGIVHGRWIFGTDADATLPAGYFEQQMPASGAALFPFRHHTAKPSLAQHAALYELHLRYYVRCLRAAGSPYAFHTLGSTMAVHADAYASVRGYPRRNGGEDFYMLNKLAKVAPVNCLTAPEIRIAARVSSRVPFGTGPALKRMASQQSFDSYALASFDALSSLQRSLAATVRGEPWRPEPRVAELLDQLDPARTMDALQRRHRRSDTLCKALHQWFDGFRTLRFVHTCRRFHPDISVLHSVSRLLGEPTADGDAGAANRLLERLRADEPAASMGVEQKVPHAA